MLAPNMVHQLPHLPTNRIAVPPPTTQHASKATALSMTFYRKPASDDKRPLSTPAKRILVGEDDFPGSGGREGERVPAVGT